MQVINFAQALLDTLQPALREAEARQIANSQGPGASTKGSNGEFKTAPKVPMCYAESIASTVISKNKDKIEEANKNVMQLKHIY